MQSPHANFIREMIKDDPVVQELLTKAYNEAYNRAYNKTWTQSRLQGLQEAAMNILHVQFPALAATPQAQQAVASIQDAGSLGQLLEQLFRVSDEQTARIVLGLPSE